MPNRNPKQPETPAESESKPRLSRPGIIEPWNWLILTIDFLVLGAGIFLSWRSMQYTTYKDELLPAVTTRVTASRPKVASASDAKNSTTVELKLNQRNERVGPEIQVDPGNIGRTNPFQRP